MGPMTWEAVATFVTGGLAVLGAVIVGWRQIGIVQEQTAIASRQADILGEQVRLEKLAFHESMFDRRMGVYEGIQAYLVSIVRTAAEPPRDAEIAFLEALGRARFLFRTEVSDGLREIWKEACSFSALKSVMSHTYRAEGHYGQGNPDKEAVMLSWFNERLERLPDLFGTELRLGQDEPSREVEVGAQMSRHQVSAE